MVVSRPLCPRVAAGGGALVLGQTSIVGTPCATRDAPHGLSTDHAGPNPYHSPQRGARPLRSTGTIVVCRSRRVSQGAYPAAWSDVTLACRVRYRDAPPWRSGSGGDAARTNSSCSGGSCTPQCACSPHSCSRSLSCATLGVACRLAVGEIIAWKAEPPGGSVSPVSPTATATPAATVSAVG